MIVTFVRSIDEFLFLLRAVASPPGFSGWTVISRVTHLFASLLSALFIPSEVRDEGFHKLWDSLKMKLFC